MTVQIRRAAAVLVVCFIGLSVGLVYWQIVRSEGLDLAASNPRVAEASRHEERGAIFDARGQVLAHSVLQPDGRSRRVYALPSLAQTIGYVSTMYGVAGLESSEEGYLSGQHGAGPIAAVWQDLTRQPGRGNDLVLTIDAGLQQIAARALGDRKGAVIALDPATGAVKAIVSSPAYDPNQLDELGASLVQNANQPLLNRATQGLYPPGSTYKTVTASAALDSGIVKPSDRYKCINGVVIQGFVVACTNAPPGQTQWDFLHAYTYSINATFAQVAVQFGAVRFADYSHRFGVGDPIPFDIDVATSRLLRPGASLNDVLLASSGFGQGQLSVTPLQMALVAATIANGGSEPSPYLVGSIRDPSGNTVLDRHPAPRGQVIRPETAQEMQRFMLNAVNEGFGQEAGLLGLDAAGKSGTAETGTGEQAHGWFIGFAPAAAPKLAVAVIVENGGAGGLVAGPIAAQLFKAAAGR
ncbi:MAG: peptidoglycan D,D-transpeptidase FtsI family protein [Dehalococcoidia bacterium]